MLLTLAGSTSATTPTLAATSGISGGVAIFSQGGVRDNTPVIRSGSGTTSDGSSWEFASYAFTLGASGGVVTITPATLVGGNAMDLLIISLPTTVLTVDEKEQLEIDELRFRADEQDRKIAALMRLVSQPSTPMDYSESGGGEFSSSSSSVIVGSGGRLVVAEPLADLEKSVHLPRSLFKKLAGLP